MKTKSYWNSLQCDQKKYRQMSIKVAQNDFTKKDFNTFTKIAKNVGNLAKIIVATGFEKLPKVK